MPDLIQKAKKEGRNINVCPIHEFWLDIGKPELLKSSRGMGLPMKRIIIYGLGSIGNT